MKKLMIFGLLSLALSACNGSESVRQPSVEGPTLAGLEGIWMSSCLPNGQQSLARSWEFQGNQFTSTVLFFTDSECQTYDSTGEGLKGTFRIAGASDAVPGAWKIDLDGVDAVGERIVLFDLVSIDRDSLVFGNFPGQSAAERSTELNPYTVYKKAR